MARAEATITVKDMPEVTALIERLTERAETAEATLKDVRLAANWHLGHEDPTAGDALAKKVLSILDRTEATG